MTCNDDLILYCFVFYFEQNLPAEIAYFLWETPIQNLRLSNVEGSVTCDMLANLHFWTETIKIGKGWMSVTSVHSLKEMIFCLNLQVTKVRWCLFSEAIVQVGFFLLYFGNFK